jgi:hypothetical protein
MVVNANGQATRPASEEEVASPSVPTAFFAQEQVKQMARKLSPTQAAAVARSFAGVTPVSAVGGCPTPSGPYIDPGTTGGCAPRGQGYGWFGLHTGTLSTTAVATTVSPQRPVTIKQLVAQTSGPYASATLITSLKVNTDLLLHGSSAPSTIFLPDAAAPVPFDMTLSTADTISVTSQCAISPTTGITGLGGGKGATIEMAGLNCYNSNYGLDYACSPLGKGNRSIILGMGSTTLAASAASTGTASQSPSTPIRLGRLVIAAYFSNESVGGTVLASTGAGYLSSATSAIGNLIFAGPAHPALDWIKITEVSINDVNLLTNIPTNGGLPGTAFAHNAVGTMFPDVICSQADTIKVKATNLSPIIGTATSPTGSTNAIKFVCAWVGCEVLGSC